MQKLSVLSKICEGLETPFSTQAVMDKLKADYPEVWQGEFLSRHPEGGRGCGHNFSASNLLAMQIPKYGFVRCKWGDAAVEAENWGSGVVAMWRRCVNGHSC